MDCDPVPVADQYLVKFGEFVDVALAVSREDQLVDLCHHSENRSFGHKNEFKSRLGSTLFYAFEDIVPCELLAIG